MDENPYKAPREHPGPPARWLPLVWHIAATVGLFFVVFGLMCGLALLAGLVPSGHVVLFSIAAALLVLGTAVGIDARLKGKRAFRWLVLECKSGPPTAEQAARLRFWLPFLTGSVTGVILSFWVAPYLQALIEVLAGRHFSTLSIGIVGAIIEVGFCYAMACFGGRSNDLSDLLEEGAASRGVGPWSGD
jgi:hypothetical protein